MEQDLSGRGSIRLRGTFFFALALSLPASLSAQLVADIAVTKTDGLTSVVPGTTILYTIVLSNNGPDGIMAAVVDIFPATLTGVNWTCTATVGSICLVPSGSGNINNGATGLSPGGSATFIVNATVAPSATGSLTNTANVSLQGGAIDPNLTNNSATDTDALTPQADLSVTLTGPSTVIPGSTAVFTTTVTNLGPSDAQGVLVTQATPPGVTFVSNSGACTTAFPCSLGAVPASQTRVITTTYQVPSGYNQGPIVVTSTVSSGTADPVPGNNVATATAAAAAPVPTLSPTALVCLVLMLGAAGGWLARGQSS